MHGHKFFFTYSGLSEDFGTKEELLQFLQDNIGMGKSIVEYRIGRELHPKPADPEKPYHFHAYWCSETKMKVKDPHRFDWKGHHGDYYTIGKNGHPKFKHLNIHQQRQYVIDYVGKDGDYIENLNAAASAATDTDAIEKMVGAGSEQEAMDIGFKEDPHLMVKNFSNVHKAMKYYHNRPAKNTPCYELCEFDHPKLDLRKPAILHWGSNMNKTEFAKAHFNNPLVVAKKDGIKEFVKGIHDGLIFNDYRFNRKDKPSETWTDNEIKHLTDNKEDKKISCRNKDVTLPKDLPIIFVHNGEEPFSIFPLATEEQDLIAMKRRFGQIVKVTKPLCKLTPDNRLPSIEINGVEQQPELPVRQMVRSILRKLRKEAREGNIILTEKECSDTASILATCRKRAREES